jgi:hypothetical protein
MRKPVLGILAAVAVVAAFAWQHSALREIRRELAALRGQLAAGDKEAPAAAPRSTAPLITRETVRVATPVTDPRVETRLASLEQAIAELEQDSRHLMDRGALPPDAEYLAEMRRKFLDPATSDRDRLAALRVLRRGNALADPELQFTANWLMGLTDERLREDLLRNLEGMTNAQLRTPFLQLAAKNADARVREQALDNLQRYLADPEVEALMWDRLRNDPEQRVRDEAERALRSGPFTEARITSLRQRALDPATPLAERLMAANALGAARTDATDVFNGLAQMAQPGREPVERMQILQAFDGTTNRVFVGAFVQGLQDPDAGIRRQAVDSLSGLRTDPVVNQWLRHVAQSDPDPQVRREAEEVLRSPSRR